MTKKSTVIMIATVTSNVLAFRSVKKVIAPEHVL